MKKDVFVKGTRLITTAVFFVSMFFTDRTVRKVIAAVIILWLLIVMVTLSIRGRKRRHGKTGKTKKKPLMGFLSRPFIWEDEPTGHPGKESPAAPLSPSDGSIPKENIMTDGEIRTMKQHIALRIADKLKSAYPASVWQRGRGTEGQKGQETNLGIDEKNNLCYDRQVVWDRSSVGMSVRLTCGRSWVRAPSVPLLKDQRQTLVFFLYHDVTTKCYLWHASV